MPQWRFAIDYGDTAVLHGAVGEIHSLPRVLTVGDNEFPVSWISDSLLSAALQMVQFAEDCRLRVVK
jgi:hypothetical protein